MISLVTYLVDDYDCAIAYFIEKLGFTLVEDTPLTEEKRWVRVTPIDGGVGLLLAKASTPEQVQRIGDQTGGRVFLFLETQNFERDYESMKSKGVEFLETPRQESYGTVAVFRDLYGNKWDLVELRKSLPRNH